MPQLPWSVLSPSAVSGTSHAIRVDAQHPYDFFWALSAAGCPQLICSLPTASSVISAGEIPSLKLIKVRSELYEGHNYLIVELQDRAHQDNFFTLCSALVEATRKVKGPEGVMPVCIRHLARWQQLLGKALPSGILSLKEQIGLIGELLFLESALKKFSIQESILSWASPLQHPQDFLLPSGAVVEVKCRQATTSEVVHIASQHQLHQPGSPLFLVVFSLGGGTQGQSSCFSLDSLVQRLRSDISSSPAHEEFEIRLLQRGYMDQPDEYSQHWWRNSDQKCFYVTNNFPRFIPDQLPSGVIDMTYTISLPACSLWSTMPDEVFNCGGINV